MPSPAERNSASWIDPAGNESVLSCVDEGEEVAALRLLWTDVFDKEERSVRPIVGFNHLVFDLRVLLARSMLLGVSPPYINLDKYRTPHIDLMDRLTFGGKLPARSLKWFAKRFGLPVDDSVSGADIAVLAAAGDWLAIEAHCRSDIRLTKALYEFVSGRKTVAA